MLFVQWNQADGNNDAQKRPLFYRQSGIRLQKRTSAKEMQAVAFITIVAKCHRSIKCLSGTTENHHQPGADWVSPQLRPPYRRAVSIFSLLKQSPQS